MKTFEDYCEELGKDAYSTSVRTLSPEDDRPALASAWIYCAFSEYLGEIQDGISHADAVAMVHEVMGASVCYPYQRCGRDNRKLATKAAMAILRREHPDALAALSALEIGVIIQTLIGTKSIAFSQHAADRLAEEYTQ